MVRIIGVMLSSDEKYLQFTVTGRKKGLSFLGCCAGCRGGDFHWAHATSW
jgi:hypothetical protein